MKKILALSLTFALFACGGSHRSEADLVIDFKHKKEVFDKLDAKISNDAKLKLDYDKQKFQQIFDDEMKKMAEQGK